MIDFEKWGVLVKATADDTGHATAISVSVPSIQLTLDLWTEENSGRRVWNMKDSQSGGIQESTDFAKLWDNLPEIAPPEAGEDFYLSSVLAEIVDRHGRVTEPGGGISMASLALRENLEDFAERYSGHELVELLSNVLISHGYGIRPDIEVIKVLGKCTAYHELGAATFDTLCKVSGAKSAVVVTGPWTAFKGAAPDPG
jgi:hypothetical protein